MLQSTFCLVFIWMLIFGLKIVYAASAADNFYKGKAIRLIVPSPPAEDTTPPLESSRGISANIFLAIRLSSLKT
jgi:hypothetical protein